MRIAVFCHSLLSDWNHGNAHFLRGLVTELIARGHQVRVYEPVDAWSYVNLIGEKGDEPVEAFGKVYPMLDPVRYHLQTFDPAAELDEPDLILVHEWNDPALVARLGRYRAARRDCRLLFHDTHHRSITQPEAMAKYDLSACDGVLAFGQVIRDTYLQRGWARRAWVFHEAADVRVFRPLAGRPKVGELVWVGNWGDEERAAELHRFLLGPIVALKLTSTLFGVRYTDDALAALKAGGIRYGGWVANFRVPEQFARHRVTVHIPRRPYAEALPGIPTIRPFEAMACGIPLICSPWEDREGLFTAGSDYLVARDGDEMKAHLRAVLSDAALARSLAEHGRRTILGRHTCGHRAGQLMEICGELGLRAGSQREAEA
ncbi:MAG: glycosyltransferase [Planctomycetes bacterium]|nr:glycosyltransferase [Planctomycetota bacterium]